MGGKRQKSQPLLDLMLGETGEARDPRHGGAEPTMAGSGTEDPGCGERSMEEVCERENLKRALQRVRSNKGSPGVDGMTVEALPGYLVTHWLGIREELLNGRYRPQPVLRVEIPKPDGGVRKLGIPTVLDRFIQQAVQQVLQKRWDPTFSEHSHGFRPKHSAHQAVAQAQRYIQDGYAWVADLDLEKFFDRVNQDRLMARIAEREKDKRRLKLIRAFLKAGVLEDGLVGPTDQGTPQGGPLSPLLSNIVLDELDRELERRGHRFVRYADDCNIYVRSERAGQRVMESITRFITSRLKLTVNREKSAVARPQERKILGFTFLKGPAAKRSLAPKTRVRFRKKIRELTGRMRGRSLQQVIQDLTVYLRGWGSYFGFCQTPWTLRDLDSWIRRRLRCLQWKHWRNWRRRLKALTRAGVDDRKAKDTVFSARGPWRQSSCKAVHRALPNQHFHALGLPTLESFSHA